MAMEDTGSDGHGVRVLLWKARAAAVYCILTQHHARSERGWTWTAPSTSRYQRFQKLYEATKLEVEALSLLRPLSSSAARSYSSSQDSHGHLSIVKQKLPFIRVLILRQRRSDNNSLGRGAVRLVNA